MAALLIGSVERGACRLWRMGDGREFFSRLVLKEFTDFRGSVGEQRGRSERGHQPEFCHQQRPHRQAVQQITGGGGQQDRLDRRLADTMPTVLAGVVEFLFGIVDQGVDALLNGRRTCWR